MAYSPDDPTLLAPPSLRRPGLAPAPQGPTLLQPPATTLHRLQPAVDPAQDPSADLDQRAVQAAQQQAQRQTFGQEHPLLSGVESGWESLKGGAHGLAAAAAGTVGMTDVARQQLVARDANEQAQQDLDSGSPQSLSDVHGVGDAFTWAEHQLGALVPGAAAVVLPALATGGLSAVGEGIAARAALGAAARGIGERAIAGEAERLGVGQAADAAAQAAIRQQAARNVAARAGATIAEDTAPEAVEGLARSTVADNAMPRLQQLAAQVRAPRTALGTELRRLPGAVAGGAVLSGEGATQGLTPDLSDDQLQHASAKALTGAAGEGVLQALPGLALINRYGVGEAAKATIAKRMGAPLLKRLAREGAEQGAIGAAIGPATVAANQVVHNWITGDGLTQGLVGPDALSEYLNSAAGGALGGALMGAPAGLRRGDIRLPGASLRTKLWRRSQKIDQAQAKAAGRPAPGEEINLDGSAKRAGADDAATLYQSTLEGLQRQRSDWERQTFGDTQPFELNEDHTGAVTIGTTNNVPGAKLFDPAAMQDAQQAYPGKANVMNAAAASLLPPEARVRPDTDAAVRATAKALHSGFDALTPDDQTNVGRYLNLLPPDKVLGVKRILQTVGPLDADVRRRLTLAPPSGKDIAARNLTEADTQSLGAPEVDTDAALRNATADSADSAGRVGTEAGSDTGLEGKLTERDVLPTEELGNVLDRTWNAAHFSGDISKSTMPREEQVAVEVPKKKGTGTTTQALNLRMAASGLSKTESGAALLKGETNRKVGAVLGVMAEAAARGEKINPRSIREGMRVFPDTEGESGILTAADAAEVRRRAANQGTPMSRAASAATRAEMQRDAEAKPARSVEVGVAAETERQTRRESSRSNLDPEHQERALGEGDFNAPGSDERVFKPREFPGVGTGDTQVMKGDAGAARSKSLVNRITAGDARHAGVLAVLKRQYDVAKTMAESAKVRGDVAGHGRAVARMKDAAVKAKVARTKHAERRAKLMQQFREAGQQDVRVEERGAGENPTHGDRLKADYEARLRAVDGLAKLLKLENGRVTTATRGKAPARDDNGRLVALYKAAKGHPNVKARTRLLSSIRQLADGNERLTDALDKADGIGESRMPATQHQRDLNTQAEALEARATKAKGVRAAELRSKAEALRAQARAGAVVDEGRVQSVIEKAVAMPKKGGDSIEHSQLEGITPSHYSKDSAPGKGMSVDEVEKAVRALPVLGDSGLLAKHGIQVRVIPDKSFFGERADQFGDAKGGFTHSGRGKPGGTVVLAASRLRDARDVRTTVTHEVVAHFGLNLFAPADKRAILERIGATRSDARFAKVWKHVAKEYADFPPLKQAEEAFAYIAQNQPSKLRAWFDAVLAKHVYPALRRMGLLDAKVRPAELRALAKDIAEGIRGGKQQRTFPDTDGSFRRGSVEHSKVEDEPTARSTNETRPVKQRVAALKQHPLFKAIQAKLDEALASKASPRQQQSRAQAIVNALSKALGVSTPHVELFKPGDHVVVKGESHSLGLGALERSGGKATLHLADNLEPHELVSVLTHEFGHHLQHELYDKLPADSPIRKAIEADFKSWSAKLQETDTGRTIRASRAPFFGTLADVRLNTEGNVLGARDAATREYLAGFSEYFADNTARALQDHAFTQTVVGRFFARVAEAMKLLYDFARGNPKVADLITPKQSFKDFVQSAFEGSLQEQPPEVAAREAYAAANDLAAAAKQSPTEAARLAAEAPNDAGATPPGGNPPVRPPGGTPGGAGGSPSDVTGLLNSHDRGMLERLVVRRDVFAQLLKAFPQRREALLNYGTQMEAAINSAYDLWRAGKLKLTGDEAGTGYAGAMRRFRERLVNVFGLKSLQQLDERVFNELKSGAYDRRTSARVKQRGEYANALRERAAGADGTEAAVLRGRLALRRSINYALHLREDVVRPLVLRLLHGIDNRLRETNNPALRKFVSAINRMTGEVGGSESFINEVHRLTNVKANQLVDLVDKLKPADEQLVLKHLMLGGDVPGRPDLTALRDRLYGFTRQFDMASHEGGAFGSVGGGFFPWRFDHRAARAAQPEVDSIMGEIGKDQHLEGKVRDYFARFYESQHMADALRTPEARSSRAGRQAAKDTLHAEARKYAAGLSTDELQKRMSDILTRDPAAHLRDSLQNDPLMGSRKPGGGPSMNPRAFAAFQQAGRGDLMARLQKFQAPGIVDTMLPYLHAMVKRQTFYKDFVRNRVTAGSAGAAKADQVTEQYNTLDDQLAAAKRTGASDKDLQLARDYMDAQLGLYGDPNGHPLIQKMFQAVDRQLGTKLGAEGSRTWEKISDAVTTYQNFRVLGLGILGNLIDPLGNWTRASNLGTALSGYREALKNVGRKGSSSYLRAQAEALGIAERHALSESLSWAFNATGTPGTLSYRLNQALFKYNGMTMMTNFARMAALASGHKFLLEHAQLRSQHSERYLRELGLTARDIKPDAQHPGYVDTTNAKVQKALFQFVDEAVVRPHAGHRPLWHADPGYKMLSQYRGFIFSFYDTIVKRMLHEAKNGNLGGVAPLAGYLGVTMAAEMARSLIQYGPSGNPEREQWGPADWTMLALERSGALGPRADFMNSAYPELAHSRVPIPYESLTGPTISQADSLLGMALGRRSTGSTALQALPGESVYRGWIHRPPAADTHQSAGQVVANFADDFVLE